MQLAKTLLSLALVATHINALPTSQQSRGVLDFANILDEILVFDSPAFPDPINPANTLMSVQTFVSLRQINLSPVTAAVTGILASLGINVGDSLNILQDRLKLFGAVGLPGKSATLSIPGCSHVVKTAQTSGSDLGLSLETASLGKCSNSKEFTATASLGGILNDRNASASIFSSPDSGFGVISDIDDTVKVSYVLDKVALLKATLLEDPKAVTGMPELYASLAKSLNDPQFVYVSGSPFQLYPFLKNFIDTAFSASKGPFLVQNLTLVNPAEVIEFISNSDTNTETFKLAMIDRLKGMYPNKKWLAIGDSTQRDPEVYGESFRKFGPSTIVCSWIRRVDGANNTDARFASAFAGVPANKFRIYTDADIPNLANINVAGGEC
ncbi:hypothetical protein GALMADRAFT_66735 [Galerina marginata CBS 339.88]|uniref:Phosphatidate phosphatase APP1 catalytic domain-containing protein n=1 Tax=Galerina marginata (strain CBS 339.88) TaxID=685588 RepID=A0A067T2A5_GALM3|nr:hypothetical protein GALMADRAFT_66735 [Galerina marginata CBS 339.88]